MSVALFRHARSFLVQCVQSEKTHRKRGQSSDVKKQLKDWSVPVSVMHWGLLHTRQFLKST